MIIGLAIPDSSSPSESSFKGLASPNSRSASIFTKYLDQAAVDTAADTSVNTAVDTASDSFVNPADLPTKSWQLRAGPPKRNLVERGLAPQVSAHASSSTELARRSQPGRVQPARSKQNESPYRAESIGDQTNGRRSQQAQAPEATELQSSSQFRAQSRTQFSQRQFSGHRNLSEVHEAQEAKGDRRGVSQENLLSANASKESTLEEGATMERSGNPGQSDHLEKERGSTVRAGDSASVQVNGEKNGSDPAQTNAGLLPDSASTDLPASQTAIPTDATGKEMQLSLSSLPAEPPMNEEGGLVPLEAGASGGSRDSAPLRSTSEAAAQIGSHVTRSMLESPAGLDGVAYGAFGTNRDRDAIGSTAASGQLHGEQGQLGSTQSGQDPLAAAVLQQVNAASQKANLLSSQLLSKTPLVGSDPDSSAEGMSSVVGARHTQEALTQPLATTEPPISQSIPEMGRLMVSSPGPVPLSARSLDASVAPDGSKEFQAMSFDPASSLIEEAGYMNLDLQFDPLSLSATEAATAHNAITGELPLSAPGEAATDSSSRFGQEQEAGSPGAENRKDPQPEAESWRNAGAGGDSLASGSGSAEAKRLGSLHPAASGRKPEEGIDEILQKQQLAGRSLEQENLGAETSAIAEQPVLSTTPGFSGHSEANSSSPANPLNSKDPALSARGAHLEAATQKPLASTVHQLRIEIPIPGADGQGNDKIQLHFNQRNSALNLGIQANNSDLGLELRDALPELARKLGTSGWQAEAGSSANAHQTGESAFSETQSDLARPWRQQDLGSMLAGERPGAHANDSHPGSTPEGSEGGSGKRQDSSLRHESSEAESFQQPSGQQSDSSSKDTNHSDSSRRDRRGRQQNWNRTWTGLNSTGLNSTGLNSGATAKLQSQSG